MTKRLKGDRVDRALKRIEGALSWAREHGKTGKARNLAGARGVLVGDDERTFVHGSHNMLFRLDARRWDADLEVSHRLADVRGFQEAGDRPQRLALKAHAKKHGLGRFHPRRVATPILWRKDVFEKTKVTRGARFVHPKAGFARYNPGRFIVWVGLRHKATGAKVLVVNLHATAGYAKTGRKPWGSRLDRWKDKVAKIYWTQVQKFLRRKMERGGWDVIVVGGDFNARLENRDESFFPGPMLERLVVEDDVPRSIDRLVFTEGSKVVPLRRWAVSKGVHSDHSLHFAKYRITL